RPGEAALARRGLPPRAFRGRAVAAGAAARQAGRAARAVHRVEAAALARERAEPRADRERDPPAEPRLPIRTAEAIVQSRNRQRRPVSFGYGGPTIGAAVTGAGVSGAAGASRRSAHI